MTEENYSISSKLIYSDFLIIDTEGQKYLREIAIVNSKGRIVYEAFDREHPEHLQSILHHKPLQQILLDFEEITQQKLLVFHNAKHDLQVLKNSFSKSNLFWRTPTQVQCTYRLARKYFPALYSYSLEYLAKKLNLKVEHQYFNTRQAHLARYDAQFTYQLYLAIQQKMTQLPRQVNPFGSSRVDNPFQTHPDNPDIYQAQYAILESIIDDIKHDRNHQSKGAVVIGEPGTGKTHLIMRLAYQRLKLNRLLFVPCPNDANTIKYHIYSCILESLNKQIPQTNFNQLEYLLANAFVGIIKSISQPNQRIQAILAKIQTNPLKLYEILGGKDTQTRRNNWDAIERITSEWWLNKYGAGGYASEIIKGIVKYCRYSDPGYKQLVKKWLAADELEPESLTKISLNGWQEEISKEDFSLEAIAVLAKLSLLHEPLIIVFDQLEMLGLQHNQSILFNFGEAVKEIFTRVPHSLIIFNLFPNRWQQLQQIFDGSIIDRISQYQMVLQQPQKEQIHGILQLKAQEVGADLTNLFTSAELEQIWENQASIRTVLNRAADYFRYKYQNIPLPKPQLERNDLIQPQFHGEIISRLEKLETQQNKLEKLLNNIARAFNDFSDAYNQATLKSTNSNFPIDASENSDSETESVFNRSIEKKVIDYLETQQQKLEQEYSDAEIILDEKDLGKLKDIIEAFKKINTLETDILPSKRVLPPHLIITNKNLCIGFLSSCKSSKFTSRIQNYNEFVATKEQMRFLLWQDARSDTIKEKTVGSKEIIKLDRTKNGQFRILERNDRITFELIYKFISDIYNQDLEIDPNTELAPALKILANYFQQYWLIKELL